MKTTVPAIGSYVEVRMDVTLGMSTNMRCPVMATLTVGARHYVVASLSGTFVGAERTDDDNIYRQVTPVMGSLQAATVAVAFFAIPNPVRP